jgi:hypothetical protein
MANVTTSAPTFYLAGAQVSPPAVVGYNNGYNYVARYQFTVPAGVTADTIAVNFGIATFNVGDGAEPIRYKVTTSPTSHVNAGAGASFDGTLTFTDSGNPKFTATASGQVLIAQAGTYYLYIFPGSGNIITWSWPTTAQTLTLTATQPSTVSASNGDIGSTISISINKAAPSYTHTIEYAFGNAAGTIVTKTTNAILSWTPPMSLCSEIPNDVSGSCVITCKTYSGDNLIGTTYTTCTLSVPSNIKPSVSDGWASVSYYNTGTPAASIAAFVQGYSKAEVTFDSSYIDMSGCYGATIASYRIALGSYVVIEAPYRTPTIETSGQLSVLCVVIDSRGRYTTAELPFTAHPYSQPTLSNIEIFRCLSDGTASNTGTYISCKALASCSSINGLNSVALTARYKLVSAPDYGSTITLVNNQPNVIGGGQILTTSTYLVQLIATDSLNNTSVIETRVATESVAFNIRAGGQGAAFGKFCESDKCLELPADWSIKIGGVDIFDIIFFVGIIVGSGISTSPAALVGGVWQQIKDRMILAVGDTYTLDETGGSATHKHGTADHILTVGQMPKHKHTIGGFPNGSPATWADPYGRIVYQTTSNNPYPAINALINQSGNNEPHNHGDTTDGSSMPPYIAKYIWQRIA